MIEIMDNKKIINFLKANDINPLLLDPIKQDASNRLEQGKAQINQLMQSQQPPNLG